VSTEKSKGADEKAGDDDRQLTIGERLEAMARQLEEEEGEEDEEASRRISAKKPPKAGSLVAVLSQVTHQDVAVLMLSVSQEFVS
jgi:hypothetical protein